MLNFDTVYFKESTPYHSRSYHAFFAEYRSVSTVDSITTVTTSTVFSTFCQVQQPRRCEAMKDGLLVARKPQAKIFGEVELAMLKSLQD
jgi:hypothetical protein